MSKFDAPPHPPGTQTLMRGLDILDLVAQSRHGTTIQQAAEHVGVHRTMAMRSLAALCERNLIRKSADGKYRIAAGVVALAREYQPALRDAARPILAQLADTSMASATLFVTDGDAAVALLVVEPGTSTMHLTFKTGSRHPMDRGSASYAILSGREPSDTDSEPVREARRNGYSHSRGEVEPGASGIGVPLNPAAAGVESCLHITTFHKDGATKFAPLVMAATRELELTLMGERE